MKTSTTAYKTVMAQAVRTTSYVKIEVTTTSGIVLTFDNSNILKAEQTRYADPLMRQLPENTYKFTILDYNDDFNPDNPTGNWQYVVTKCPVVVWHGQEVGNEIEWFRAGFYLLDSKPTVSEQQVSFSCNDTISFMTDEYFKGAFNDDGTTLYDLAIAVIDDANITFLPSGTPIHNISQDLQNITTTAPLPIAQHNECLQLIANAACCRLYTDANGTIHIDADTDDYSADPGEEKSYYISFRDMKSKPITTIAESLRSVKCNCYRTTFERQIETLYTYSAMSSVGITLKELVNVSISANFNETHLQDSIEFTMIPEEDWNITYLRKNISGNQVTFTVSASTISGNRYDQLAKITSVKANRKFLAQESITVLNGYDYGFTHELTGDKLINITGASYNVDNYAQYTNIHFTSSGVANISILAEFPKTLISYSKASVPSNDPNGEIVAIENSLCSDFARAQFIADYARDYLLLSPTYEFDYIGDWAVEPGDIITIKTDYTATMKALVLSHTLTFDRGALSGHLILKSYGEVI